MRAAVFLVLLVACSAWSVDGSVVALRLDADSGSLLQVIDTGRNDSARRVRRDTMDNVYIVVGSSNQAVLKYSSSGVLSANITMPELHDISAVAAVGNITFISARNASNPNPSLPTLYSFFSNGTFAGSVQLNLSTFIDNSLIPTSTFFDMRASGEIMYLGTADPVGFIAWNTTSGKAIATKFGETQLFPVALGVLDDLIVTWSNSSTDALLVASHDTPLQNLQQDAPIVVPDRSSIVGLDFVGDRLITYDVKRGVFKRISVSVPVWSDYVSVSDLGDVKDFAVDSQGHLIVLVDRDVVPVDYCSANILDCNEKTTRCVASLTSGRCQCLPGFSVTDLADNFCLPGCSNETCSDGTCVLSISECPPVQACSPMRPKRCPRGDCVPVETQCAPVKACASGLQLCVDGACRKDCSSTPFAGCPRFTCPDGTCASRYDACKGCNETSCSQPVASAVFPFSQSFKPYTFSIISSAFTIGLPSISIDSDHVLARISFPDSFIQQPIATVSFAEASTLKYRDFFNQKQIASKIVTLIVNNGTTTFNAEVSLLTQIPDGRSESQLRFSVFNTDSQTWTHLSLPSPVQRQPNGQFYIVGTATKSGDYAVVLETADFPGWGVFLIVLAGLIVVFVALVFSVRLILKWRKK